MFWCCVNLPRWGLKRQKKLKRIRINFSVNLPRWGLKLGKSFDLSYFEDVCKFTPLGFETPFRLLARLTAIRVNLPRWGLKPKNPWLLNRQIARVNLPRWGLKQKWEFKKLYKT